MQHGTMWNRPHDDSLDTNRYNGTCLDKAEVFLGWGGGGGGGVNAVAMLKDGTQYPHAMYFVLRQEKGAIETTFDTVRRTSSCELFSSSCTIRKGWVSIRRTKGNS
jgi:hypothetical protein